MTNVDARMLEMLRAAGEDPETSRQRTEAAEEAAMDLRVGGSQVAAAVHENVGSDEWCRENPSLCFGRGPTGRLRNFRAMNDSKLTSTFWTVRDEGNDSTALDAIRSEMISRGLGGV